MPKLRVYTKSHCPFCQRALDLLRAAGVAEYDEISIDGRESELREEIRRLTGGRSDVPQVFVDDQHIGDDDDLADLVESGELDQLMSE
jgi:glutaredoxin 3